MEYHVIPHCLPGYPDSKTIRIVYDIPAGIQVGDVLLHKKKQVKMKPIKWLFSVDITFQVESRARLGWWDEKGAYFILTAERSFIRINKLTFFSPEEHA